MALQRWLLLFLSLPGGTWLKSKIKQGPCLEGRSRKPTKVWLDHRVISASLMALPWPGRVAPGLQFTPGGHNPVSLAKPGNRVLLMGPAAALGASCCQWGINLPLSLLDAVSPCLFIIFQRESLFYDPKKTLSTLKETMSWSFLCWEASRSSKHLSSK